jgi:HK97 family phage portal protein
VRLWPSRSEQRALKQPELQTSPYVYLPASTNGAAITPVTALMNANVWACVRVLADAAASCPLITYRRLADDSRRRVGGRTAELLDRPAEGTVQADLISTLVAHLLLHGNAYLGKFRDADGRIDQLLPLDPTQVSVERRGGKVRFSVVIDGRESEHDLGDLIHVKALSTDGLVGLSPIRQMRLALEGDAAVQSASRSLFANHARPSGIISVEGIQKDQANLIKEQWTSKHAGELSGGIAVLSGELTFTPIAMSADDAQFVEARKLSAVEISRAFRVPPWMIGAETGDSMTYSNVESQALSFVVFSLQPWLRSIEQALSADRDLFGPSSYAEFLIDGLLRADSRTRAELYTRALDPLTGWMTRAEVRRLENLEPEPASSIEGVPSMNGQGQGVVIA